MTKDSDLCEKGNGRALVNTQSGKLCILCLPIQVLRFRCCESVITQALLSRQSESHSVDKESNAKDPVKDTAKRDKAKI